MIILSKRPPSEDREPGHVILEYPTLESGRIGWQVKARNGEVIAEGQPEGFEDKHAAERAADNALVTIYDALAPGNDFYINLKG